jgi:hypothetical protein
VGVHRYGRKDLPPIDRAQEQIEERHHDYWRTPLPSQGLTTIRRRLVDTSVTVVCGLDRLEQGGSVNASASCRRSWAGGSWLEAGPRRSVVAARGGRVHAATALRSSDRGVLTPITSR